MFYTELSKNTDRLHVLRSDRREPLSDLFVRIRVKLILVVCLIFAFTQNRIKRTKINKQALVKLSFFTASENEPVPSACRNRRNDQRTLMYVKDYIII